MTENAVLQLLSSPIGLGLYGLVMFLEGTGLPGIPYEAFFLAAGVLIAAGRLALFPLLVLATVTNTVGTLVGYYLGAWGGRLLLKRYGPFLGVRAADVARVEEWYARWGGLTLIISRIIGLTRTPAILLAGIARMDLKAYLFFSTLTSLGWCTAQQLLYLYLGRAAARFLSPRVLSLVTLGG
ncbi:MAG TPA: DedA family protein, partial [Firmicutes bacterium]|nr:DedA family protein [Bacillota bacterium]